MRYYQINELTPDQLASIADRLREMELSSPMGDVFFLPLPPNLLDEEQARHAPECGPHILALELDEDAVKMELLVRARGRMRCPCIKMASPEQREYMMGYLDNLLEELGVQVSNDPWAD
jgi:hypothetical protein